LTFESNNFIIKAQWSIYPTFWRQIPKSGAKCLKKMTRQAQLQNNREIIHVPVDENVL